MKHILSYNALLEHAKADYNPLSKLLNAEYTSDRRYVIVEGKAYSCETGERAPLNEEWSVSDVLHLGADVLSMGLDMFVFPGAGMTVDILNTISYVIEAQFAPPEKQGSLYIMALISYAFIILPGPLQAVSIPLKRFIKSGAGRLAAKGPVKKALEFISGKMGYILKELPKKIKSALSSKLGQTLLGKTGVKKVIDAMKSFTSKVGSAFNKIMGRQSDEVGKVTSRVEGSVLKKEASALRKSYTIKPPENIAKEAGPRSPLLRGYYDSIAVKSLEPMMNKLKGLTFNSSKVKVLRKSNVLKHEAVEVEVENGQKILMYKSTGANEHTTGKKAGEWFAIPGWGTDGYFIKSKQSIALCKGGNKYLTDLSKFLEKNGPEGLSKSTLVKSSVKTLTKDALKKVLPEETIRLLKMVFSRAPKAIPPAASRKILKKLGFIPGKPYRYINPKTGKGVTAKITGSSIDGKNVFVQFANKNGGFVSTQVPVEKFIVNAIGAPWGRRGYTAAAPFFIKQYARMVNSAGDIDPALLDQLDDLDPNMTSTESLAFLQEEVGSYEGDEGTYTVDQDVTSAQTMLSKIVYPILIDGKFGPQTKEALEKFQQDYGLSTSLGKLDNATILKLKEVSGL